MIAAQVVSLVQASWSPAPLRGPGDSGANLSQAALAGRLLVESVPHSPDPSPARVMSDTSDDELPSIVAARGAAAPFSPNRSNDVGAPDRLDSLDGLFDAHNLSIIDS